MPLNKTLNWTAAHKPCGMLAGSGALACAAFAGGAASTAWPFPSAKSPGRTSERVTVVAVALGTWQTIMVAHLVPGVALDCLDRH
jgi:hypothetical protein